MGSVTYPEDKRDRRRPRRREAKAMQGDNEEQKLTGFGLCVFRLMTARGMIQQKELLMRLRGVGYRTNPQNLSNWLHGTQPPLAFVQAVVKAMALTPVEEDELYRSYVWESKAPESA
jgi:hypothetical protein